ncbi:MAG: hypothetical protein DKM50_11585 [Candidatus Margulisiibacteriota bacterium]|nr:MAG: hypothetical protein A2X43_02350 [Candidatus Margulisbacteria bacterium GWD2_39_127]OGI01192.1 MAG: hypothetical protein A2X42_06135 [Candidatus Margulisbacteria bacterium GWF2_38_17]OGI09827.1 MAG: hypothetical protein A2X41_09855 [Candidatus Margulisbacteria bacterium GWE2_39_32]PZM78416.1 MAG: hypothetical protein DKM50_11585 [Candidatus Margulisiibacteriota bacterium]HAR62387.1 hypothetical protein [Candidatus Margulisiibacteriota bacterium]
MKIVIANKEHENIDDIKKLLPPFVTIIGAVTCYEELKEIVITRRPDVVLFNMNMAQDFIADPMIDCPYILAVADIPNPEYLRLGVEIRARDLLIKPFHAERLNDAINKSVGFIEKDRRDKQKNDEGSKVQNSKIISFFSTQGGVGQTVMAVNLAIDLKRVTNGSVVVVDGNALFGSVPIVLDLYNERSMTDIVASNSQSDIEFIESMLLSHSSGVKILPGPHEDLTMKVSDLITILNTLKTAYNYVILDLKKMFVEQTIDILDISDIIFVLMSLNIPCIRNTNISLNKMRALYYSPEKIKIIVNEFNSSSEIEIKDVESHLNWTSSGHIPYDKNVVLQSINEGKPFVLHQPGTAITAAIRNLSYVVEPSFQKDVPSGSKGTDKSDEKKGLFKWLKK